jgi:hypothetical protein
MASNPPFWVREGSLPSTRLGLAAVVDSTGTLYAVGGAVDGGTLAIGNVDRYDPAQKTWTSVAPLTPRGFLAAAVPADGLLYALGGIDSMGKTTGLVESFDPASPSSGWVARASLAQPRHSHGAASGPGGLLYAIGGFSGIPLTSVELLKPNGWVPGPDTPSIHTNLAAASTAVGTIYVIDSGFMIHSVSASSGELSSWASIANMPSSRARDTGAAATGPDGRIYAIGGQRGYSVPFVDAYSPADDTWVAVADLLGPRSAHAAAVGADGRIYAIGGSDGGVDLATVESYGPRIQLTPTSGPAGQEISLTADNFAALAKMALYFGAGSCPLVTAATDGAGVVAPLKFKIPSFAKPGVYTLRVIDNLSRYPVTTTFTVTP